jgi:hypothetical protein
MTRQHAGLRTIARTLQLACILGLLINVGIAAWHVVSPETAPKVMANQVRQDEPAYLTGATGSWRGALPRATTVRVVDSIEVDGKQAPVGSVWAGQYDPVSGGIEIIRTAGDLALAHEYGHALLMELAVSHDGQGVRALALFDALAHTGRNDDPASVPDWLRRVFDEYRKLPADPYGDSYYGMSFNEYFAQSFACTVTSDRGEVAPVARAFFCSLEPAAR